MEIKIIKVMVKGTLSYIFKKILHNISLSLPHQIHNCQKIKLKFDRARQGVNSTRTVIMLNTHAVTSATIV